MVGSHGISFLGGGRVATLCPQPLAVFVQSCLHKMSDDGRSESPCALLLRLAKPSVCLDQSELRWAQKLAVMSEDFLACRFTDFVRRHSSEPRAISYSNDPTPLTVRRRIRMDTPGEQALVREGGKSVEFLIQRAWGISYSGERSSVFTAPKKMADKSAASHFGGLRSLAKFPLEMGHRSLNIAHMVCDRGIFSAQERLFRQAHCRSVEVETESLTPGERELQKLLSWVVTNGCCDHDCHGALHRSFARQMDDKPFMREIWKNFASVRNGFASLNDHAWEWVSNRLCFKDWSLTVEAQEQLWRALGLEPDWCELLLELELRWEDGSLCVAERHRGSLSVVRQVVKAQLRSWQFRVWTESRWLSIGGRARSMILCCLLGITDLVSFCLTTKKVSGYYLGGFGPTPDILQFLIVCGLSAFVSESPLAFFFKDDRLPSNMDRVSADLGGELEALMDISDPVWRLLAGVASMPPQLLRHQVIMSGNIQASYLLWRCQDLQQLPWSLVTGDMSANLRELKAGPRPTDLGCATKIYDLLQMEYPEEEIIKGVMLLGRLSCSAKRVEEGHVQGSRLLQLHRKYGEATMMARSQIGQLRPMVAKSAVETKIDAVDAALQRLAKKNPNKCGAKQIFLGSMVSIMQEKKMRASSFDLMSRRCAPKNMACTGRV